MRGRETEDLTLLLTASEVLLKRVDAACKGFPAGTRCRVFVETYREAASRLIKKFPEHPRTINLEKADRLASEVIWREAKVMLTETEPLYSLLQDTAVFQERTVQFLLHVDHAVLQHVDHVAPLSLEFTPDLLGSYMQLFCNAVRLHMLARGMPRALIMQLHTLLQNLVQVQAKEEVADPANRMQLVAFVQAHSETFVKLQSDFQCVSSRIGQVLESSVFPLILAFKDSGTVRGTQLLDVKLAAEKLSTGLKGWRGLQWLQRMKEWAIFAFIACPGESIRPAAFAVIEALLQDTVRIRVYREHCEWLHPIFLAHVRPTMLLARPAPGIDRKAHKRADKALVGAAQEAAASVIEHGYRRILAAQSLEAALRLCTAEPARLARQREFVFAVLAYARDEVLWYFLHVNEELPGGALRALLGVHQPLREYGMDPSLPRLLAAMHRTVQLLLQYRTAIQAQVVLDMQTAIEATIQPGLESLQAAEQAAPNAELLQIHEELSRIAASIGGLQAHNQEAGAVNWAGLRKSWEQLAFKLTSSAQILTVEDLEAASGGSGFLPTFADIMQQSSILQHFQSNLTEIASMAQLSWCIPKVAAAVRSTVEGGTHHLRHAAAWLFVFPSLQGQPANKAAAAPSAVTHGSSAIKQPMADDAAERLTEEWMQLVTDRLVSLLCELHQGVAEVERPLIMAEILKAQAAGPQDRSSLFRSTRPSSSTAPAEASRVHPGLDTTPGAKLQREKFDRQFQDALALVQALSTAREVRVNAALAVCPKDLLQDAVRRAVGCLLRKIVFSGKDLQLPSAMNGEVSRLWRVLQRLSRAAGDDFLPAYRAAAMSQLHGSGLQAGLAFSAAAWIIKEVVVDARRLGSCMAPAKHAFTSSSSKGMRYEDYTSPVALTALLRSLGLTTAAELAACSQKALQEPVAALDGILKTHYATLDTVYKQLENNEDGGWWEACRKAAGSLGDLSALLEALHAAARVLFFRQLLSRAVAAVFEQQLPAMHASLVAAACRAGGQQSHVCDLLGLPRPRHTFSLVPAANQGDDPALVHAILADGQSERMNRWRAWPVLLGLTLQSSAWASPHFDAATGSLSGRLDGLPVCAPVLASTVVEVCARRGHPCESRKEALACFAKCVICGLTANKQATSAKLIASWQIWEGLPDWRMFEHSVVGAVAETMLRSAHRHASAVAAAPHGKQQWHQ